jgi:hypothetical protein
MFPVVFASGQTVILEEHFNSPDALINWDDQSVTGQQFSIQNGVLISSELYQNLGHLVYLGPNGTGLNLPDSFEIAIKARLTQTGYQGSDAILILFHFIDNQNLVHTGWRQRILEDWHFRIYRSGSSVYETWQGPLNFDETQWHTVRIVKNNTTVTAYLNGVLVFSDTVSELSNHHGGTIALTTGTGTYEFDDLVVTVPGPPPPSDLEKRVEDLEAQVQTLINQNEALQQRLDNLETLVENHSHNYLTGKGAGHNNELATTGPPTFPAAPEPHPAGK